MQVLRAAFLSATLTFPLAAPVWAETERQITVTGESTIEATPDLAIISLGVTTDGPTAAAAMSGNSAAMQAVIARLKAVGVAERDLQTSNLSLNPNWVGYDSGQTPTIAGYVASNMLSVRVRGLEGLGAALDASIADGANTLNGITFDLAAPRPIQDAARAAALEDARARAAQLAAAAGLKLGGIVAVMENPGYGGTTPMFRSEEATPPVPLASGQIGLTASVTVTFELVE